MKRIHNIEIDKGMIKGEIDQLGWVTQSEMLSQLVYFVVPPPLIIFILYYHHWIWPPTSKSCQPLQISRYLAMFLFLRLRTFWMDGQSTSSISCLNRLGHLWVSLIFSHFTENACMHSRNSYCISKMHPSKYMQQILMMKTRKPYFLLVRQTVPIQILWLRCLNTNNLTLVNFYWLILGTLVMLWTSSRPKWSQSSWEVLWSIPHISSATKSSPNMMQ